MVTNPTIHLSEEFILAKNTLHQWIQDEAVHRRCDDLIELLQEWGLTYHSQVGACLLPVLQQNLNDTLMNTQFSERAIHLCRVTQSILTPNKSKSATPRAIRAEHLRKCYKLAYTDSEALLFILGIRLVSLGDIDRLNTEERIHWAEDNLNHYLPVFELLGLKNYAQALRDISLRLTNKPLYQELEAQIEAYYTAHQVIFTQFQRQISELFTSNEIQDAWIKPQELSPANLYTLTQEPPSTTPTLPKQLIIDILLDQESACYRALGLLHGQFLPTKPVIDGLAAPRHNGYRALSTTIAYPPNHLIMVNIRTHEAEKINTHGILGTSRTGELLRNVWWNTPNPTISQKSTTPNDPIGVFAPDGRWIYPLQQGFTVLDFAFRIHSELGAYAHRFWVNGKPAVHHYALHHTDLVEIDFDRHTPHITADWLSSAYSAKTRRHIKTFLKRHHPPTPEATNNPTGRGRIEAVLEREMGIYRLRFSAEQIEAKLKRWAISQNYADTEALYQAVELGNITADEVVCTLIEEEFIPHIIRSDGKKINYGRVRLCRCWMMAEEHIKWTIGSRIAINTPIVGRMIGKDKPMLMVHRTDCLNAPSPEDAIRLNWQKPTTNHESAEIIIHAPFRFGVPSVILHKLESRQKTDAKDGLVLHRFQSETNAYQTTITCTISAPNMDIITALEEDLQALQARGDILDFSFWGLFHSEHIHLSGKFDKRQHNPYTLKQIRDQAMFFGRDEEIKRVIQYLKEGETFIVLYGQKRIGKTSLMEHLAGHLLPKTTDMLPIFFDALSLAPFNTVSLLRGLIETATPHITRAIKRATLPTELRLRPPELQQNPFTYFAEWVKRVEKRLGNKRLLFMIDEFTRAEEEFRRGQVDESFFSGFQWLAGNQHIGFFICVHDHIYRHNTQSWGFLQRGHPLYLRTLDKQAARKLIQLPLQSLYQFDDGVVDDILDLTNGHPYFIQAICLELSVHMAKQDTRHITPDDLQVAIGIVLYNGEHYFNHFHNRVENLINNVLKCVALLANDDENQWVERDKIQETALEWQLGNRISISESIGALYQAGIIEAQKINTKVAYRIPIKLFQFWLRQSTHPLIKSDIQRN
ncbi:MAG: ATP-binding protein [bacterium]|nr:ATP-binding protein [bacterium]